MDGDALRPLRPLSQMCSDATLPSISGIHHICVMAAFNQLCLAIANCNSFIPLSVLPLSSLRLQRFGRTHAPFYRMVAADSRAPRDGRFLEIVGTYNPIASSAGIKEIRLKTDRLRYWLSVGAQPSDRVAWILGKFGVLPPPPPRYSVEKMVPKKDQEGEVD